MVGIREVVLTSPCSWKRPAKFETRDYRYSSVDQINLQFLLPVTGRWIQQVINTYPDAFIRSTERCSAGTEIASWQFQWMKSCVVASNLAAVGMANLFLRLMLVLHLNLLVK